MGASSPADYLQSPRDKEPVSFGGGDRDGISSAAGQAWLIWGPFSVIYRINSLFFMYSSMLYSVRAWPSVSGWVIGFSILLPLKSNTKALIFLLLLLFN